MAKLEDVKREVSKVHPTSNDREGSISRRDWLRLVGAAGIVGTGIRGADATINRLLLEFYQSPNNGRQIATTIDGRRLLLVHSKVAGLATIHLWRERLAGADRLDGFEEVGQIVGPETQIRGGSKSGFGACCVWHDDRLLVAWSAAEGIVSASVRLAEKNFEWTAAETVLRGKYLLGDMVLRCEPHASAVGRSPARPTPATEGLRTPDDRRSSVEHVDGSGDPSTTRGSEKRKSVATYHYTHSRDEESVGIVSLAGKRLQREIQRGRPMFAPVAECDA